ncbi:TIGR02679 domain-containing protein [Pseudonocardia xishanensis]|uniref:TIGR02679 family protein n=1 Tax=Pseudonocardia xishanensis TaxID=630995 RepID=A0ABP8S447_9PSEU
MTDFLTVPELTPLWNAVRAALDRNGLEWRGRLTLPVLPAEGRRRLGVLLERPVPAERRSVPLAELAAAVERLSRTDLVSALTDLGHRPSGRREARLAHQEATRLRRAAVDSAVEAAFPDVTWAGGWGDAAWTDGLFARKSPEEVQALVTVTARVLQHAGTGRSRTELAALLLGNAHALDSSERITVLVTRALIARDGPESERAVWERAGMPLDLVSAPVLTWGLPLLGDGDGGVAHASHSMHDAGLPLHLSTVALRAEPLRVPKGTPVLVVENPRLVEAAAQRSLPAAVMCTNGNPTTAPSETIASLQSSGADLRYHGDFDATGLAMAARAAALGCTPFLMTAADYHAALAVASSSGVELPRDSGAIPQTQWDAALATAFEASRLIVHEERVMDDVLALHAAC